MPLELLSTGIDPMKSTFGICDENIDGKVTVNELHQDICLETLETMFGLTKSGLNTLFPQIDTDADMKISLDEASLAFDRSTEYQPTDWSSSGWKVISSKGMSKKEEDIITFIAEILRTNPHGVHRFTSGRFCLEVEKYFNPHAYRFHWNCIWAKADSFIGGPLWGISSSADKEIRLQYNDDYLVYVSRC